MQQVISGIILCKEKRQTGGSIWQVAAKENKLFKHITVYHLTNYPVS